MNEFEAGFFAACLKLRLAVPDLHDVEASLAEDGRSVLVIAPNGDDYAVASFMLEQETTEEEFDSNYYSSIFEQGA